MSATPGGDARGVAQLSTRVVQSFHRDGWQAPRCQRRTFKRSRAPPSPPWHGASSRRRGRVAAGHNGINIRGSGACSSGACGGGGGGGCSGACSG